MVLLNGIYRSAKPTDMYIYIYRPSEDNLRFKFGCVEDYHSVCQDGSDPESRLPRIRPFFCALVIHSHPVVIL